MFRYLIILVFAFILISCADKKETTENKNQMTAEPKLFGKLPDGTEVYIYQITNKSGISMDVITYGGIITKLMVPDKNGNLDDIALGYDNLESYVESNSYFGAIIGRYGNRIAQGKFKIDGVEYQLPQNNGVNSLHGGDKGFDKVVWAAEPFENESGSGLIFTYTSADGEMGYPGKLDCKVTYTLADDNTLQFDYEATTDKTTIVNMTQHSYFNLSGGKSDILDHQLLLSADKFLPVDSTLIPTGELRPLETTPFDFTSFKEVGKDINTDNEQLAFGKGYDHCWILNTSDERINFAGTVYHPESGRKMDVLTTEPGIQFYSGNFLDGSNIGKENKVYEFRSGLCLETQHFPDSPNQPEFPSTTLEPESTYKSTTVYKFYTDK